MSIELSKHERSEVQVSAPGYHPSFCDTRMSASGGYIAADVALCILLFPIGCISFIDAGGAWNTLEQPHCHVNLLPDSAAPAKVMAAPVSNPGS